MAMKKTFTVLVLTFALSLFIFANNSFKEMFAKVETTAGCTAVTLSFFEGFNTTSPTFSCWTIVDGNKDSTSPTSTNIWRQYPATPHQGDRAMLFSGGTALTEHDDWLISPPVSMNGGVYAITYYYKTSMSGKNEFEVLLSNKGLELKDFDKVLQMSEPINTTTYKKKTLYVSGVVGETNIAWHVMSKGSTNITIDSVTIEEVGCVGPEDNAKVDELLKDKVTISWQDPNNTSWEYILRPEVIGATPPTGSGNLARDSEITLTKTSGANGTAILPNTSYEFYIKSNCGAGKESLWTGPLIFRTPCDVLVVPFEEGFNTTSTTLNCWSIVDNDANLVTWAIPGFASGVFEGDKFMQFNGSSNNAYHDDWLISPTFILDATKFYRLSYYYKSAVTTRADFDVLMSTTGIALSSFKRTLTSEKGISSNDWKQDAIILGAISGPVNFAWHINTKVTSTMLALDMIVLEEITGCPEPMKVAVKDVAEKSVSLYWTDDFGSEWEYIVQEFGAVKPLDTTVGVTTNRKENTVTQTILGASLEENTTYEGYVRRKCAADKSSVWTKVFVFRTACGVYSTPFWEGFNIGSVSLPCWTILDVNNDAPYPTGNNIWKPYSTKYEGTQSMSFIGNANPPPHNDWMISPRIKMDAKKTYRLIYHYRLGAVATAEYEFAVMMSNQGTDPKSFVKSIVPKKKYEPNGNWEEEYVFFSGMDGEVHIGWHITSATPNTQLYIDNVFIEEVTGCPEPLKLKAEDESIDSATISWEDDEGGLTWEYFVQKSGKGIPTTSGTSTNSKTNAVKKEQSGVDLVPNTDYEFYVRTMCKGGGTSIWRGPVSFVTLCSVYDAPFWEGFNKNSKTTRCWTIVNKKGETTPLGITWKVNPSYEAPQEGDQMLQFGVSGSNKESYDDWLISPAIDLDGGNYVLRYYYKTSEQANLNNEFEVLLSTDGIETSKFTTVLVPKNNYHLDGFVEQVVFVNGVKGAVNLAWHIVSQNTSYSYMFIDNISITKVENCEEPYYVKVTENPTNGFDVEWQQNGAVNEWEVVVVNYGDDESGTAVVKTIITGTPKTTITGLDTGKAFTVYVRAKCTDGKNFGDWSTPVDIATKVEVNNNCDGAINIPVNSGLECVKSVTASLKGSTISGVPAACNVNKDVWFEFTATSSNHMLYLKDIKNLSGSGSAPYIYGVLYDQPCALLLAPWNNFCFYFFPNSNEQMFMGLVPGRQYYVRLSGPESAVFNICVTTFEGGYLDVSPSGVKYSVEELVKDVLVKSSCDLVSNVHYQVGDGSPETQTVNTLGYFNKNNSIFPFEEGIVLATSEVQFVPGPHVGPDSGARGTNGNRWIGDKDINEAINDAGGGPSMDKRVTQLEFDFTPIRDSIKFEYLFASNGYTNTCHYSCDTGALFAAWLVDTTTGEGQNLAKIKGTNTSISVNNIRDASKSRITCSSNNPEYYWKHYDRGVNSPIEAPIDFVGMTVPMESETIKVVVGRKYHIKLAVMDFCVHPGHTSAVFFNAASFDLGTLDLGADLLVETETALCDRTSTIIKSGMGEEENTFEWYRNEVLLEGEHSADLEVKESGDYKLVATYGDLSCQISGSIKVEMYPLISTVVSKPLNLQFCQKSFETQIIDLTEVEKEMFLNVDRNNYKLTYFNTFEDAEQNENAIETPRSFEVVPNGVNVPVFINIEDVKTGCTEVFTFNLISTAGEVPNDFEDVKICATYTFPNLPSNQYYYSKADGNGVQYQVGDVLNTSGEHRVYVLQLNNDSGCYEETFYTVSITEAVVADVFEDQELACKHYTLKDLNPYNKYFTEPNGQGVELFSGHIIFKDQKVYVYAKSDDGLCTDESSFSISFNECPIQKGISPNGDGVNDKFELFYHNVNGVKIFNRYGKEVFSYGADYTDQWMGQDNSGNKLPDGTYYYVVETIDGTRTGWVQINR